MVPASSPTVASRASVAWPQGASRGSRTGMPTAPSVNSSHTVSAAAATSTAATAAVGATPPGGDEVKALILLHCRQDQTSKDRETRHAKLAFLLLRVLRSRML